MIQQATLDILDSELRREYDRYRTMPYKDRVKIFSIPNMRIDPNWSNKKFEELRGAILDWSDPIRYSEKPKFQKLIDSDEKGVYMMIVKPLNTILNLPQYVMYIGISGEKGSQRSLKDRLTDYQYLEKIKKRDSIHQMLQLYYEEVYIVYSLYKGRFEELERLEGILHEYYNPVYGKREFSPPTKAAKRAWTF